MGRRNPGIELTPKFVINVTIRYSFITPLFLLMPLLTEIFKLVPSHDKFERELSWASNKWFHLRRCFTNALIWYLVSLSYKWRIIRLEQCSKSLKITQDGYPPHYHYSSPFIPWDVQKVMRFECCAFFLKFMFCLSHGLQWAIRLSVCMKTGFPYQL